MSNEISPKVVQSNMDMMTKIANDEQDLSDIRSLTSSKVKDQLKVFLVSQARNELSRVVKLTQFLDKLEEKFLLKVDDSMNDDSLTLKQYSDIIGIITSLLARSNDIISRVLNDDSLMTILNTTIYTSDDTSAVASVTAHLKDPQSRERVRAMIQTIIYKTNNYVSQEDDVIEIDPDQNGGDNNVGDQT